MSYVPSEMCNNNSLSRQQTAAKWSAWKRKSIYCCVFGWWREGGIPTEKSSQVSDNCCHLTGTLSAAIKTNKQAAWWKNCEKTHSYAALPECCGDYLYSTPKVCFPLWRRLSMRNIAHTHSVARKHKNIDLLQKQNFLANSVSTNWKIFENVTLFIYIYGNLFAFPLFIDRKNHFK